jgi:hypothetical protein
MDWHELHKMKAPELREMAAGQGHTGTSGMNKDQLVQWLAEKLGIDKPHKVVAAEAARVLKNKIKELKESRQGALEAKDKSALKQARRKIHRLKRRMRRSAHLAS